MSERLQNGSRQVMCERVQNDRRQGTLPVSVFRMVVDGESFPVSVFRVAVERKSFRLAFSEWR